MTKRMETSTTSPPRPRRRASATPLLVLALALMVGTFAISLTRLATDERRSEYQRQDTAVLRSALNTIRSMDQLGDTPLELPLDSENKGWVVIQTVESQQQTPLVQATLYRNGVPGLSIQRSGMDFR